MIAKIGTLSPQGTKAARSILGAGSPFVSALLLSAPALADTLDARLYHATSATYGCPTPQATRSLINLPDARRNDQVQFRYIFNQGHCISISTQSPWKLIYVSGDVAFMSYAGTIGAPGSFYFPTALMADADGRHPSTFASPPTNLPPPKAAQAPDFAPRNDAPIRQAAPAKVAPPPAPAFMPPQPAKAYTPPASQPATGTGSGSGGWIVGLALIAVVVWLLKAAGGTKQKRTPQATTRPRPVATGVAIPRPSPANVSATPSRSNAKWYAPGEEVRVRDIKIADGMIYVGTSLGSNSYYGQDGCLINPSLPVAGGPPEKMAYWPSYGHISAQNRQAYLAWLSGGKSRRDIDMGYVFLYFYGIERRLIVERPSKEEAALLMAELNRLLAIYGEDRSFHGYATRLLTTARFLYDPDATVTEPDPLSDAFTVDRQATLATFFRDRKPISFAWVALWYKEVFENSPSWRTCPSDFLSLAKQQFEAAYPDGLIYTPPPASRFTYAYAPANRSIAANFDDIIKARFGANLPSLGHGKSAEIGEPFKKAAGQLKRYAEFVLTHSGAEESPLALARLPVTLRDARLPAAEASLREWIDGLIATKRGVVLLDTLWSRLYGNAYWAYDKTSWEDLARQLQRYRYGMAPDPLYNDIPHLRPDQPVVLFRLAGSKAGRAAPPPDFIIGQAVVFICAEYTRLSGSELPQVGERLSEALPMLELPQSDHARILASLPWCETQGQIRGRLKKTFDHLVPPRRPTVLKMAATVLNGPGVDQGQLVAFLEKISGMLGVERTELYSALHHSTGATTPHSNIVPLRTGYAIPKPAQATPKAAQGAVLDLSRINSVLADTQQAFDALTEVFDDDDPPPPPSKPSILKNGLDATYSELLSRLLERSSWSRSEFQTLTRALGLMPDGALETLNDWAFDHFDEALIDEGDPLVLSPSCVEAFSATVGEAARA